MFYTMKCFPQTQVGGMFVGVQLYLSTMASWKAVLLSVKPCFDKGRTDNQRRPLLAWPNHQLHLVGYLLINGFFPNLSLPFVVLDGLCFVLHLLIESVKSIVSILVLTRM